jgi:hypothetical protein
MFNLFEHVFRPKDMDAYQKDLDRAKQSVTETKDLEDEEQGAIDGDDLEIYRRWRTCLMSDHYPLWVKIIKTDLTYAYLVGFTR